MNKPALVLLSGLLSDESIWSHQIQYLDSVAEIFIPTWSEAVSLNEAINLILEKTPAQFSLAGHSQGGFLAMEIARRYPSRVLRLCTLNTTADPDTTEKSASRIEMIKNFREGKFSHIIDECSESMINIASIRPTVRQMLLNNEKMLINQQNIMLDRPNILPLLNQIMCSSLVIHSTQDRWFSMEHAYRIVNGIPDCKLAVIENSGHMVTMEMPEAVTSLMNYWLKYF